MHLFFVSLIGAFFQVFAHDEIKRQNQAEVISNLIFVLCIYQLSEV